MDGIISSNNHVLEDPAYYKTALSGEGEAAQRLHRVLQGYVSSKDPKTREEFRPQLMDAYWVFAASVAQKAASGLSGAKQYVLRFAVVHPGLIGADCRAALDALPLKASDDVPLFYLDEWLGAVGRGELKPSAGDEVRVSKEKAPEEKFEQAQTRKNEAALQIQKKEEERSDSETRFREAFNLSLPHNPLAAAPELKSAYTQEQKTALDSIPELIRSLLKIDRELVQLQGEYLKAKAEFQSVEPRPSDAGSESAADSGAAQGSAPGLVSSGTNKTIESEFIMVKRIAKVCAGRKGNQFPVLTAEYFHGSPASMGLKENIEKIMEWVESLDPGVFQRVFKQQSTRIVPNILLLPSYADNGICWEPFDKANRASSRGRVIIPMYPRDLKNAVISALADLRWQEAKEQASYYWMEEGLTGRYYQWLQKMKMKGEIKEFFVPDYITWLTKESNGVQKLDKEVRAIFWQEIPFPRALQDTLRKRSPAYQIY